MRRCLLALPIALVVGGLVAAPTAAGAIAASDLGSYTANGQVLNILPPGSRGNVDPPALLQLGVTKLPGLLSTPGDPHGTVATANGSTPQNFADQLEMYDALNRTSPGQLTGRT